MPMKPSNAAVATAIREQYLPRFAGDEVPTTIDGQLVAVGDRLDMLAGIFALGTVRVELGGWGVPLGIALEANGLSAALLAMANLVALGTSVYATSYFGGSGKAVHFWPLWLLLWSSLNGLFLAADLFNLYVMLELLGLSAAALGALTGSRDAMLEAGASVAGRCISETVAGPLEHHVVDWESERR